MDSPYRLKVKVAGHEFEAEGDPETVQSQFAEFKEMISNLSPQREARSASEPVKEAPTNGGALAIEKIMKLDDRVVSLTAHTRSSRDAIMMILLGQKTLRGNELVTGAELADGLRISGHNIPRVDYTANKLIDDGYVVRIGAHRGTKYRLTNTGIQKANELAKEIIELVA